MRETIFEMLRAALSDAAFDNIYIFTHGNPDGDAVGSASAMAKLLRSYGKRASVFFSEVNTPSPKLSYLECIYKNEYDFTPEHIITVDLTDMNRISGVPLCFSDLRELEKRIDFVIDHTR